MHYIPYIIYSSLTFFLFILYMSASHHMGTTKNIFQLFLPEIKKHSAGLFQPSLAENIIILQGVVDMDKRIAETIGTNL